MSNTRMNHWKLALAIAMAVAMAPAAVAGDKESPAQAGEQVGIEGTYVRVAANQEGWVVLAYEAANKAVGKDWMMLDVGMTLQEDVKDQKVNRDDIFLVTPDHQKVALATQKEFEASRGTLGAMERADAMMHDSINYWPAGTSRPCRIGFFADISQPMSGPAFDEVELNHGAACAGRLYFQLPKPIEYGTYNLDVQFADSIIRVPIEIMTEEQAKEFEKKWKEAQKEARHKH